MVPARIFSVVCSWVHLHISRQSTFICLTQKPSFRVVWWLCSPMLFMQMYYCLNASPWDLQASGSCTQGLVKVHSSFLDMLVDFFIFSLDVMRHLCLKLRFQSTPMMSVSLLKAFNIKIWSGGILQVHLSVCKLFTWVALSWVFLKLAHLIKRNHFSFVIKFPN